PAQSEDDTINNESKIKLLEFLRGSHGKEKKSLSPRKKVVLKRTSKEVLRVSSGTGVSKTKNVNIEVKKKKRSNAPSQSEMAEIEQERDAARKALDERRIQLEAEEAAKEKAAKAQREAELAAEQEAEQARQLEAQESLTEEEAELLADDEAAEISAEEEIDSTSDTEASDEKTQSDVDEDSDDGLSDAEKQKKRHEEMVAQQVQKAVAERANRKRKEAEKSKRGKKPKADSTTEDTRYGRKQLHVKGQKGQKGRVARRVTTATSEVHGFQKPEAPMVKTVAIPEHINVADLAKELSIKATDIIKVLMNMGMMVTINQPLDQDTAMLVVEELGHKAEEAVVQSKTEILKEQTEKEVDSEDAEVRPPVVTVM